MDDCMMFPEDWHDFLKDYSFYDSQKVYTNGSRLISVFRVEQLINHLLEAQEPRVMTLREVRDEAEYMFLEKHSATGSDLYGCAIRGDWDVYGIELLISEYDYARERWENYGKTWRCWTSRPTDEQREAIPWN